MATFFTFGKGLALTFRKPRSGVITEEIKEVDNKLTIPFKICNRYEDDSLFDTYLKNNLKAANAGEDIDYVVLTRENKLCGILLVMKNECRSTEPEAWSVRLICSSCRGYGIILMGLYLYIIKKEKLQRTAFLELAQGYANIVGFCSYSKFNYVANPKFACDEYDKLENKNNLKMTLDMDSVSLRQILDVVLTNKGLKSPPEVCVVGICTKEDSKEKCKDRLEYQRKLRQKLQTQYETDVGVKAGDVNSWVNFDYMKQLLETGSYATTIVPVEKRVTRSRARKVTPDGRGKSRKRVRISGKRRSARSRSKKKLNSKGRRAPSRK